MLRECDHWDRSPRRGRAEVTKLTRTPPVKVNRVKLGQA